MRCPYCGASEDKVVDSRSSREGRAIRRRRECLTCAKRFTTYEYVEEPSLTVIKSDGRREPFTRQKLLNSIKIACNKRPIASDQIEAMVEDIESGIYRLPDSEISTKHIGQMVMDKLRQADEVAYVRFASVYRQFRDTTEFMEELRKLLSGSGPGKALQE